MSDRLFVIGIFIKIEVVGKISVFLVKDKEQMEESSF